MERTYKYIFYKLYKFFLWFRKDDIPEWNAMIVLAGCISANAFCLLISLIRIKSYFSESYTKISILIFYTLIFTINYYLLIRKDNYVKILKLFNNENSVSRVTGNISILLYIIVSLLAFFLMGFYNK